MLFILITPLLCFYYSCSGRLYYSSFWMNHLFSSSVRNLSCPKLFSGSRSQIYHIIYIYKYTWYKITYCLSDLPSLKSQYASQELRILQVFVVALSLGSFYTKRWISTVTHSSAVSAIMGSSLFREPASGIVVFLQHRNFFLVYNELFLNSS